MNGFIRLLILGSIGATIYFFVPKFDSGLLANISHIISSIIISDESTDASKTSKDFICPLTSYRVSSDFGYRNDPFTNERSYHKGIDMACSKGSTIIAAKSGTVEAVGFDNIYGNYIVINHGDGYKTKYAHLDNTCVQKSKAVTQGEKIGTVGSTGYSTGPHLHFMVLRNETAINPKSVMK